MTTPKHLAAAPSLPPASVDFNKLHEACLAGKSDAAAVKAAVIAPPKAEKSADAPADA